MWKMKILNYFKVTVLLSGLTALLVGIGYLIGGVAGSLVFFALSLVMNIGSYWFSDKLALRFANASPLDASLYPDLVHDTEELCSKMNIPIPKLYISPDAQPNAFATGRNAKNSAVCFTEGILRSLERNEVRGVLAHELGHIKNSDVLLSTIASVIAGAISAIANIGIFFTPSSDDDGINPITQLLLIIIAPIAASVVQLAISRQREYLADYTAAKYTGEPSSLADALKKINYYANQIPMHNTNQGMASLYISNPFRGGGLRDLFSTHPSMDKRIQKLKSYNFTS